MCNIVERLWDKIFEYGFFVRTNRIDGLSAWNNIKSILQKYNKNCEWLPEAIERYDEMKSKFDIIDNEKESSWSDEEKREWEETHFFFQHSRIPNGTPNANLLKLMQIAYNAGQFAAEKNNNSYSKKKLDYYEKHNLNSYLSYITPASLQKMCSELSLEHPALNEIKNVYDNISETKMQGGYLKHNNLSKIKYKKYCGKINNLKYFY
jgi:hypothetical protein